MALACMGLSRVREVFNEFKKTYLVLHHGRGRHPSFVVLFPHGLVYLTVTLLLLKHLEIGVITVIILDVHTVK